MMSCACADVGSTAVQASLAHVQNILQGPSNAVPAEVSMQDGFKVPLPRRPGSLPVTPRSAASPAAVPAPFAPEQPTLALAALTPSAALDAAAAQPGGSTSRLANVSVGAWNGAPCTEDDPLRAASSGGAALPQSGSGYIKDSLGVGAQQTGKEEEKGSVAAGPSSMLAEHGSADKDEQAVPMESDQADA